MDLSQKIDNNNNWKEFCKQLVDNCKNYNEFQKEILKIMLEIYNKNMNDSLIRNNIQAK